MMADNLTYILAREQSRADGPRQSPGLRPQQPSRSAARPNGNSVRNCSPGGPPGAQLNATLGPRYAVIGAAVGVSEANGITAPEPGTLEARLTAAPTRALFIPTHKAENLPAKEITALPTRTGSAKNPTYFPLTSQSLTDFDYLVVLSSTTYTRGGPPLK